MFAKKDDLEEGEDTSRIGDKRVSTNLGTVKHCKDLLEN